MEPKFVKKDVLPESLDERVIIFFKHYDANSNSITFFECSFFEIIDDMCKVYDYIRLELHLNLNVPLKVYREGGRGILLTEERLVYSAVTDDENIGLAPVTTLVFEIGDNNEKSQYDAIVSNDMTLIDLSGNINESDGSKNKFQPHFKKKITPGITVTFKPLGVVYADGQRHCYESSTRLYDIKSDLAQKLSVDRNRMRLFDIFKDEIDPDFDVCTLEELIQSKKGSRTRKSTKETTLLYKINELH